MINKELLKTLEVIKENPNNYSIEKGITSGNSINLWDFVNNVDMGSFCYYENREDRDKDFQEFIDLSNNGFDYVLIL